MVERYYGKPAGLPHSLQNSPSGRLAALADQKATYTLTDSECPEMIRVVKDISGVRQGRRRRGRARALLATIIRAWRWMSDFAEVETADDYHKWIKKGHTAAFWLWQAREVAWLDDESGRPRRPTDLRIRTPGTEAIFGADSTDFLHRDLLGAHPERRNWQDVMSALGMSGDPTRRELVARLQNLRDNTTSEETISRDAAIVYKALAESLSNSTSRSELNRKDLRRAFEDGDGLIMTRLGWCPPSNVFTGPPVFGEYMPFAPQVPGTDGLWEALHLKEPSLADCINVLRRIARGATSAQRQRRGDTSRDTSVAGGTVQRVKKF